MPPSAPPTGERRRQSGTAVRVPRARRRSPGWLDLAALAVLVAGIVAQVVRPVAPDLGAVPDPAAWFDAALLARVEAYRAPLRVAGLARLALGVAVPLLVAATPGGRRWTARVVHRIGPSRPARAAAAVAFGVLVVVDLVALPVAFWAGYVHEGTWGFRTQGLGSWAWDHVAGRAPGWIGVSAAVGAGVVLVRRAPRAWPALAALGGGVLTVVAVFAAPLVVEPLTTRFTPLGEGPVRTEVERVLDRAGERVDTLLVADASARTTKENAYVSGLGATRRVVLYDTLLAGRRPQEVGAVLAHELAHDRNGDLPRGAAAGAAGAVVLAYATAALLRARAARGARAERDHGGGRAGVADPRAVPAVLALVAALTVASLPVQTALSRRAEAAADHAALRSTGDPTAVADLQRGLAEANLSEQRPPWYALLLWSTHPTPAARLHAAERATADDR